MAFYNLRTDLLQDVFVKTRSRHETRLLRDHNCYAQPMIRVKGALCLVDRTFIDASFRDVM